MSSSYKHIIWDWNGTLLNDAWLIVEILNLMLEKHELPPITVEQYRQQFRFPAEAFYKDLGLNIDDIAQVAALHKLYNHHYEGRVTECSLHDDTHDVLSLVNKAGLSQCVLSAAPQGTLESNLDTYKLTDYFTEINGQDNNYGRGKLETAKTRIARLEHPAHEAVLIGDTHHDYEVAEAIGADCILVSHGYYERERLEPLGIPVMDSLKEAIAHILPAHEPQPQ